MGREPLVLLPAALHHDLPGELSGWSECVLPVANERRPPFGVETLDYPADPLAFEILDDRGAIRGLSAVRRSGGGTAEFGGHDRVIGSCEAEILSPLRLSWRRLLKDIRVGRVADVLGGDRSFADRRQIVRPAKSSHEDHCLLVVGPDNADQNLDDLLPFRPVHRAELAPVSGWLVEQLPEPAGSSDWPSQEVQSEVRNGSDLPEVLIKCSDEDVVVYAKLGDQKVDRWR